MRVDENDNSLDPFRHGRCFQVEKVGPCDRDMRDGPVDFEKLEAVRRELLAQRGHDFEREPLLFVQPRRTNWRRAGVGNCCAATPASVWDSTARTMLPKCASRKCLSTSSRLPSLFGSGTLRQWYSVFQLCSSIHFFTTASSLIILTFAL